MPNTAETSEQYQSLTTSSEGRNVMPLLQPKSHFFLEDSSFSQLDTQRFGAVSLDQFNIEQGQLQIGFPHLTLLNVYLFNQAGEPLKSMLNLSEAAYKNQLIPNHLITVDLPKVDKSTVVV